MSFAYFLYQWFEQSLLTSHFDLNTDFINKFLTYVRVEGITFPGHFWRSISHNSSNRLNLFVYRGRNKPKLPLVRRISDMLQTTCPPTCPLVQVLVHFVGPKLDALDRQNSGQCNIVRDDMGLTDSVTQAQLCCYFLSELD